MTHAPTLAEVVDLLHGWYPPATADAWDAVGLVRGDPEAAVRKVLFAVDPTLPVAGEAAELGRRPAGRAPPAVPQAGARLPGDHAEGPHAGHAGGAPAARC